MRIFVTILVLCTFSTTCLFSDVNYETEEEVYFNLESFIIEQKPSNIMAIRTPFYRQSENVYIYLISWGYIGIPRSTRYAVDIFTTEESWFSPYYLQDATGKGYDLYKINRELKGIVYGSNHPETYYSEVERDFLEAAKQEGLDLYVYGDEVVNFYLPDFYVSAFLRRNIGDLRTDNRFTSNETEDILPQRIDFGDSYIKGRNDAESMHTTGGWFAGGIASGLILGLIGTGIIGLAATGSDPIYIPENCDPHAYHIGYKAQSKTMNRNTALGGGLLGTAIAVVIVLSVVD